MKESLLLPQPCTSRPTGLLWYYYQAEGESVFSRSPDPPPPLLGHRTLPAFTERYPVQCHRHPGRSRDAAA